MSDEQGLKGVEIVCEGSTVGSSGHPDPANLDFSNLPTADPHVAGKAFIDENGKVTVSAG